MDVAHEVFHGLELFGSASKDQENIVYESHPEGDGPDEGLPDGVFVVIRKRVAYSVVALVPMGVPTSWRKCLFKCLFPEERTKISAFTITDFLHLTIPLTTLPSPVPAIHPTPPHYTFYQLQNTIL